MKNFKEIFISCSLLFSSSFVWAQSGTGHFGGGSGAVPNQGANQTAKSEQSNNYMMGGVSIAMGGAILGYGISLNADPATAGTGTPYIIMGAGGIAGGVQNLFTGHGRDSSIQPTDLNYNSGAGLGSGAGAAPPNLAGLDLPPAASIL